jgi:hypothetical protein
MKLREGWCEVQNWTNQKNRTLKNNILHYNIIHQRNYVKRDRSEFSGEQDGCAMCHRTIEAC